MQIINTSNLNQARKQIQDLKKQNIKPIIVKAQDEIFNRKILENKDVNILLAPELTGIKDKLKQRDSGLNEFLCRLAKENSIAIAINIQELKNIKEKKQKAILLSRIIQNINLCKKTKTKIILYPLQEKQDMQSFLQALGSSTEIF